MNKPHIMVGTHEKPCANPSCKTVIHRNGAPNLTWIRRTYCSNECAYKMKGQHTWKRKRFA